MTASDLYLDQETVNLLIAMEKCRENDNGEYFPTEGQSISVDLVSRCRKENFILDIGRGRINLQKVTYQNRAKKIIPLIRLDVGGPPHRNPDGQEISTPHLHIYREGHGDRFAVEVPEDCFTNPSNMWQLLQDFMRYCNIVEPPIIHRGADVW